MEAPLYCQLALVDPLVHCHELIQGRWLEGERKREREREREREKGRTEREREREEGWMEMTTVFIMTFFPNYLVVQLHGQLSTSNVRHTYISTHEVHAQYVVIVQYLLG